MTIGKWKQNARFILPANLIDYHCTVANHHRIFFLWRPILRDPDDEMVLELAVKAECDYIVTFNKWDFQGIERFDLEALDPREFLQIIGVLK
jgi:predicted nucleic acid-binding protein